MIQRPWTRALVLLAGCAPTSWPAGMEGPEAPSPVPPELPGLVGADQVRDARPTPERPGCTFCEEAEARGLLVDGPAYGRGASWTDVDGDGWEDLWQSDTGSAYQGHARTSRLYRNRGDGTFEPLELGIRVEDLLANWTGSWGDYDNDGDPDLFLANGGYSQPVPSALYRNDLAEAGQFTNVTGPAGLSPQPAQWWSAAFADYDGDGFLDLVVSAIAGPLALYHNEQDGTFRDRTRMLGLRDPSGDTKNPVWFDFDNDGDPDLYVASTTDHVLFRNEGGTFNDVTRSLLDPTGVGVPVFAAAAADFDQDGWEDLYLGRWDQQGYVLLNQGGLAFRAVGADVGLDMQLFPVTSENTMGLTVGDLGDDGWPEILIGPGRPSSTGVPIVYCNEGAPLGFHRCGEDFVAGQGEARNHGVALADPDHDGDLDVFWNLGGHVEHDLETGEDTTDLAAFYVQRPEREPRTAVVHLVGTVSNRDAIGARLAVEGTETRYYTVHGMQGFPAQNSAWLPVSLGDSPGGTVRVEWPSGLESVTEVRRGDRLEIVEPIE